jgi:hypothetical protein
MLLVYTHVVIDRWERHLRKECANGKRYRIKPKRVWHSEDPRMRLSKEIPGLKSLPRTMEPIEVTDIVGNKNRWMRKGSLVDHAAEAVP